MNNQLRYRKLSIVLTLFMVLVLAGCGKKAEQSSSTTSQTPTTSVSANPASGNTTYNSNQPASGANRTAILASAQKLGVKPQNETTCPSNALIKGKITNKRGNIYHVPKSLDYEKVKPDICFKDINTAQQAGFRAPK